MTQDTQPEAQVPPRGTRRLHYSIIILLALVALLPGNSSLPLIDRDEPRFTQATREMIQRGEWVVPYFNGEYRFDKPAMTYWLMRGSFLLFGQNEFAARLHSVLAALLVAVVIYKCGKRWFSPNAGLWAAGGWLTCLQVFLHGRLAVADMPMVFAVALAHFAIYQLLYPSEKRKSSKTVLWLFLLYGSLAFGFLSKGPIALLCPALTLALYRWAFRRKQVRWARLKLQWSLPATVLLVALWGVPALLKTQGQFWQVGMNEHVVQRGLEVFNGRLFSPLYYLFSTPLSLFPWIGFAGVIWSTARSHWGSKNAFLVSWMLGPFLVFSLYATQLPHYVLPGFPAFFLLFGQAIDAHTRHRQWHSVIFWGMIGAGIMLAGALAGITVLETFSAEMKPLRTVFSCLAVMVLCFCLLGLVVWNRLRQRNFELRRFPLKVVLVLLAIGLCWQGVGGSLRQISPAVKMRAFFDEAYPTAECLFYGFEEPSVVFYSNRRWRNRGKYLFLLQEPGARLFVVLQKEARLENYLAKKFPKLIKSRKSGEKGLSQKERGKLIELGYRPFTVSGLNLARSSWVKVEVWYRPPKEAHRFPVRWIRTRA